MTSRKATLCSSARASLRVTNFLVGECSRRQTSLYGAARLEQRRGTPYEKTERRGRAPARPPWRATSRSSWGRAGFFSPITSRSMSALISSALVWKTE